MTPPENTPDATPKRPPGRADGAARDALRRDRRELKRRRLRRLRRLALILGILAVVLVVASLSAAAYTERSSFCEHACHEMAPYGASWEASAHHRVACVRCHIKPGFIQLVKAKGAALREVYVHFTRQDKAPISVTEDIPDSTCSAEGCHPAASVKEPLVLTVAATPSAPPVPFSHRQHVKVPLCIDCHARVVHRSVPGEPFVDPRTMAACLRCHDGKQAPGACQTCHQAPHPTRGACTACHQLGSWASTFKHPVTLGVRHRDVSCEKCHSQASPAAIGFPAGCVSCHAKRHKTVKEVQCAKCHLPTHWTPSTFSHPRSGCLSCHTRPHPDRGPCLRCHTTSSWASHFAHPVALGGVHAGFACERCHTSGLNSPGKACTQCHGTQHGGLTDCQQCHTTTSFVPSTFNHPPAGEHGAGSFACSACHPNGDFTSAYCSCHGGNPPSGG
jgi:c(7)-type cytochrome triheme protein